MASSEAGSKKEPYGIPRRVIPKKRGGIGRAGRLGCPFWSAELHSHATSSAALTWKYV